MDDNELGHNDKEKHLYETDPRLWVRFGAVDGSHMN